MAARAAIRAVLRICAGSGGTRAPRSMRCSSFSAQQPHREYCFQPRSSTPDVLPASWWERQPRRHLARRDVVHPLTPLSERRDRGHEKRVEEPKGVLNDVPAMRRLVERKYRVNDEVGDEEEIRFVDANAHHGLMRAFAAKQLCAEQNVDLVMVNDSVKPPVGRAMSFAEILRNQLQEQRQLTHPRKSTNVKLKELRLSPTTDKNDFLRQVQHAKRFIEKRMPVKFHIKFKSGQRNKRVEAIQQLDRVVVELQDVAKPRDLLYRKLERDEDGRIIFKPMSVYFELI